MKKLIALLLAVSVLFSLALTGWDKVTPPVRCYMKLCDCRRAAPPVRRVCIGLFHARKMFRHIKAQSVKSSKLVVKSI